MPGRAQSHALIPGIDRTSLGQARVFLPFGVTIRGMTAHFHPAAIRLEGGGGAVNRDSYGPPHPIYQRKTRAPMAAETMVTPMMARLYHVM